MAWLYPRRLERLVKEHSPEPVDLIVILEGTYHSRIDYAFQLAGQGYTDEIYFPSPGYDENMRHLQEVLPNLDEGIRFSMGSRGGDSSTFREALLTRRYLRDRRGYRSVMLITSPYHSYRAWWIFAHVLKGYRVISVPVSYEVPWKKEGRIDETHRHVRYAPRERFKFVASYILYSWMFGQ